MSVPYFTSTYLTSTLVRHNNSITIIYPFKKKGKKKILPLRYITQQISIFYLNRSHRSEKRPLYSQSRFHLTTLSTLSDHSTRPLRPIDHRRGPEKKRKKKKPSIFFSYNALFSSILSKDGGPKKSRSVNTND